MVLRPYRDTRRPAPRPTPRPPPAGAASAAFRREATMQLRSGAVGNTWIQLFLGGLAIFVIVEQALARTGNPNYIPTLLVVGAFLVPVTLVAYLYEREPVGDVPLATVAVCFLWGGALGTVIAGLLEYRTLHALGPLALL